MTALHLEGVGVTKGGVEILRDVELTVPSGSVLGVVGASGSGKSTLLRAIAGLDEIEGSIRFDGIDVTGCPTAERNVGVVFQAPVLYPTRSVRRNISFPLEMRHEAADEIARRVGAEARAHHIDGILRASPRELAAGDVQVVQIARALVRSPDVLLLDEPFAHLDPERTGQVRRELMLIQRGFGVTTVIATNDSVEALTFADRLAVIESGRVTQVGAPLDIYEHPNSVIAAFMTGEADVFDVHVATDRDGSWLVHDGFSLRAWAPAVRHHRGRRLQLVVRPEWWSLSARGAIGVGVDRVQRLGGKLSLSCRIAGRPLMIMITDHHGHTVAAGDTVRLRIDRYVLIDPVSGSPVV